VHYRGENSLFVERAVVVKEGTEVEVRVCGFVVNLIAQCAVRFPVQVNIKQGK
jgi:hypothetical protein